MERPSSRRVEMQSLNQINKIVANLQNIIDAASASSWSDALLEVAIKVEVLDLYPELRQSVTYNYLPDLIAQQAIKMRNK